MSFLRNLFNNIIYISRCLCFHVSYLFWWQWGRDKEVFIILSLSLLIRANLLENFGKAGPL